ncbi:hypothetical protein HDV00_010785, partial [Rhizophlyctis rosea]
MHIPTLTTLLSVSLLSFSTLVRAATPITITISGAAQGTFSTTDLPKHQATLQSYTWGVTAPRDAASGLATGKRQYQYITITRIPSLMSTQILKAISTNENIRSVTITTSINNDPTGNIKSALTKRMILTGCNFVSYQEDTNSDSSLETFILSYQKVEVDVGTGIFVDDAMAGALSTPSSITSAPSSTTTSSSSPIPVSATSTVVSTSSAASAASTFTIVVPTSTFVPPSSASIIRPSAVPTLFTA